MNNVITVIHQSDIKWDIDGMTLAQAIEKLSFYAEDYGSAAILDLHMAYEDNDQTLRIIHNREETDQEAQARIDKAQKEFLDKQKRQEQADLRVFEELRKKLGK